MRKNKFRWQNDEFGRLSDEDIAKRDVETARLVEMVTTPITPKRNPHALTPPVNRRTQKHPCCAICRWYTEDEDEDGAEIWYCLRDTNEDGELVGVSHRFEDQPSLPYFQICDLYNVFEDDISKDKGK